jgi:acetylornithine deacetylase
MKGGCAALIEAYAAVAECNGVPDDVMLALVVGEEETGDGTRALLDEYSFRRALVAEPTDLKVCLEHYGYVGMAVRTFGSRRHAAMSSRDTNAIRALLRFLLELEDRTEQGEPETVLNIRDLHSSESGFAVPDRCSASIDLHIPPGVQAHRYAEQLRAFAETHLEGSSASRYEIEYFESADGYRLSTDDRLVSALRSACAASGAEWQPDAFRSHSDANMLKDAGCSPVIFGPGQLAKAHSVDEAVQFEQVVRAARIYARVLEELDK